MRKGILIILFGISVGYWLGFKDARNHDQNVVTRVVQRVGGDNRQHFQTDVDSRMERLER
jgi:hypothetical protein